VIRFFQHDRARYPFLSNFYPAPILCAGHVWPTSEHLYQALKTDQAGEREGIRLASTPAAVKRLGRTVTLRSDWEQRKIATMRWVLWRKFTQHPALAARLLGTGEMRLVEDNPADGFWGTGYDGTGQNMLGALLMELRDAPRRRERVAARCARALAGEAS